MLIARGDYNQEHQKWLDHDSQQEKKITNQWHVLILFIIVLVLIYQLAN